MQSVVYSGVMVENGQSSRQSQSAELTCLQEHMKTNSTCRATLAENGLEICKKVLYRQGYKERSMLSLAEREEEQFRQDSGP